MKAKRIIVFRVVSKLVISCFLLFITSVKVFAQKASEDFKKVGDTYKDAHISFDVQYVMYPNHSSETQIQTKQASYYIWDHMLCYKIDEVEVINNNRFNLSIDHKNKKMVLNKTHADLEKKFLKQALKINLDSLLAKNSEVVLLNQSEQERNWRVKYKRSMKGISYIDIKLDLTSYKLLKIILYYSKSFSDIYGTSPSNVSKTETPRLEITYINYKQLNEEDKEKYFSANQILSIDKKGNVLVTDSCKKYFLANYYQLLNK